MKTLSTPLALFVCLLCAPNTPAADAPEKPIRALLVLGGCCHDYDAQRKILTEGISARADVEWTIAYDADKGTKHKNPVYDKPDWAKGFDVVVHDECTADVKDAEFIERRVLKPHRDGLPAVVIHCGEHSYRSEGWPKDTPWFQFTGVGSTGHGAQRPIAIGFVDKEHPVTKGLEDWTTVNEELYNNVKLYDTAHPLARGKQGNQDFVVAWTNIYNGKTRVFATTIGHNNQTVGDSKYLDLVTRGLLWSLDKLDEKHFKGVKSQAKGDAAPATRADVKKIAASLKAPEGFELTVFAAPPDVLYPTVVAAAPTGEVFVGIDEMGSLGRQAGRGRVVRCVDTDGDGVADKFTTFATMDHPRGLAWDGSTHTLYVQHPPFLTAYVDEDGDGVADRSEVLVKGTANERAQAERGADHTTNGIRLGIDGWVYIAMGDFGCTKAVGKDGTELTRHGGGVVRVRTDGSGLEAYTQGQRNIYDVAIDPLMNAFTRDNTNDGDGWDVRLSYVVPGGNYGYPTLFKNFADEIVQPLLDLGGGSPCGSLYVNEPGMPAGCGDTLFTVEWGRNAIMRHPLTANGAGFRATQQQWMDLPRGTDMDVDGQGRFYVTSWAGGEFNYSGPNVGYLIRLAPKGQKPTPFPDLKRAGDEQLLGHLASASAVCRQAAQREILHRGEKGAFAAGLERLATSRQPLPVRAAAVFTLEQLLAGKADATLAKLAAADDLREVALRALADRRNDAAVPLQPFIHATQDANARVRLVAAWGLGRLGHAESADALVPLLADADPLVAHVAVAGLVSLRAADACLNAVDSSTPALVPGATRVLQSLHVTRVVDGLVQRLRGTRDPQLRGSIYRALCRLAYREAEWDGRWWGTRPDTSGPYYKAVEWEGTERVKQALREALAAEKPEMVRTLVVELKRNKVDLPEATPVVARLAATDATFRQLLVDLLASKKQFAADEVSFLRSVAVSGEQPAGLRAKAVRLLAQEGGTRESFDALFDALVSVRPAGAAGELGDVYGDVTRDFRLARHVDAVRKLTASDDAARREVAYVVLLNLARSRPNREDRRGSAARTAAAAEIDKAWPDPARTVSLLRAMAAAGDRDYGEKVLALKSNANAEVARTAADAARRLGLGNATGRDTVETLGFDKTLAAVRGEKGDPHVGAELFTRLGCVTCHTVSTNEPPKGPPLAGISARYNRAELCESVLKPSARVAQGFETQWFKTSKGDVVEGFVTREAGDELEYRDTTGANHLLKKSDVQRRGKRDTSMMPEGLAAKLSPRELAGLLAYLESLKGE